MRSQINHWLPVLPLFSNPVDRQQAPALRVFFLSIILAAIVWMLGITPFIPRSTALFSTHLAALMIIGAHWLALRLLRRGRFDLAVMISSLSLLLAVLTVITIWGPHTAAGMVPALTVSLLLIGLLGSRRSLMLNASLSISGVLLLTIAETQGLRLPGRASVEVNPLLITGSVFVLSTGVMLILLLQFGHTLRQAHQAALVRQRSWNTPAGS